MPSRLDQTIAQVDGRYLSDAELSDVQGFVNTYGLRLRTYNMLRERSDELILSALRQLMRSHRQVVQTQGNVCKRDMGFVLRYVALSVLRDDTEGFVENLVLWMENITKSLKKEESAIRAYQSLRLIIQTKMSDEMVQLIDPYLDIFIKAMATGTDIVL